MAAGFLTFPVLAALSVVLLMFHVLLQSSLAVKDTGKEWNAGPRDADPKSLGVMAGRAGGARIGQFPRDLSGFRRPGPGARDRR